MNVNLNLTEDVEEEIPPHPYPTAPGGYRYPASATLGLGCRICRD